MRGLSSLPLDDDILDRIFIFLPDFSTLLSLRLTSKAFDNIYQSHPNSIIRAICYNITGPALPQAIRAARHRPIVSPPWEVDDISLETSPISPISTDEIKVLREQAQAVEYLENFFSMLYKDRTSSVSKLNSMESWRFRRAMYRLMLYSNIFPAADILERVQERDEDEHDPEELREERSKRQKLLATMNTYDLYEIYSVSEFVKAVIRWLGVGDVMGAVDEELYDLALARGPIALYEACSQYQPDLDEYRDVLCDYGIEEGTPGLLENYLSQPLQMVLDIRKAKAPPQDDSHWLSILDVLPSTTDICSHCVNVRGHLKLWSEASWNMLFGMSSTCIQQLPGLVPGQLLTNVIDGQYLRKALHGLRCGDDDPDLHQTKLLREIHEVRTGPYEDWKKEDLLCEGCIVSILRFHLHLWLLERKRKEGLLIQQENCWYGWDCRTQSHKHDHAKRLNHACAPTKQS